MSRFHRGTTLAALPLVAGLLAGCQTPGQTAGAGLSLGDQAAATGQSVRTPTGVVTPGASRDVSRQATSARAWQMPTQLTPTPEALGGEPTVTALVPGVGPVRAKPDVAARIGTPLQPVTGPNRTVLACRSIVTKRARELGARDVEAVSAGPEQRDGRGHYSAPVKVRITYPATGGREAQVTEATLACEVDARQKIVDAQVIAPTAG